MGSESNLERPKLPDIDTALRRKLAALEYFLKILSGPALAVALVVFGCIQWHYTGRDVRDLMVQTRDLILNSNKFMAEQSKLIEEMRLELRRRP